MSFLRSFLGKQAEQEEAIPASLQAGTRDLVDRVAPSALLVGHDCVAMQGAAEPGKERALMRHWWVEDLPPALSFESLDPILQFPGRVCTSMLVNPVSASEALQALRQERTGQVSSLVIKQKQGRLAEPETAANLESLTAEMSDLQIARRLPLQLNWVMRRSSRI
jgi:hypothetical protein